MVIRARSEYDMAIRDQSEFMTRGAEDFDGRGGTQFQTENLGGVILGGNKIQSIF